jgi:hypothetical protein
MFAQDTFKAKLEALVNHTQSDQQHYAKGVHLLLKSQLDIRSSISVGVVVPSTNHKAGKVLTSTCCSRDDAPDNHTTREVDCRLSRFIEEQVRWNLHQYISYKQNRDCGLFVC